MSFITINPSPSRCLASARATVMINPVYIKRSLATERISYTIKDYRALKKEKGVDPVTNGEGAELRAGVYLAHRALASHLEGPMSKPRPEVGVKS